MQNLFDKNFEDILSKRAPLAARMRPRNFLEFVGQEHILGSGKILRKAIDTDNIPSMILWGPPASGKTTLAHIISSSTNAKFITLSAVNAGVAEIRKVVNQSRDNLSMYGKQTILFVDEIHRFNKAQQDVILPHVEDGTFIFIGATTENPSFEVITPLLSRCSLFTLRSLTATDMNKIVLSAIRDKERGLGDYQISFLEDSLELIIMQSSGDPRIALNLLELLVKTANSDKSGRVIINNLSVTEAVSRVAIRYDKNGEDHYNTISAFIKSIRGSDPNGALYWLVRMLEAGEDPLFIARRLIISASEDVGLADPYALSMATAAQQAVHVLGMPEGSIPLAEAAIYLATAPKSNAAYAALKNTTMEVKDSPNEPIPMHLRNPVTKTMNNLGYGDGYKYPYDFTNNFVEQTYLPNNLSNKIYYVPSEQGYENLIRDRLSEWWSHYRNDEKI
ncbi:MAG: replication-associated recombination protein A [Dehalococcoidia bacterium]|nr:replication-associated recombination protein A [Dehalococcoidia bacterium]